MFFFFVKFPIKWDFVNLKIRLRSRSRGCRINGVLVYAYIDGNYQVSRETFLGFKEYQWCITEYSRYVAAYYGISMCITKYPGCITKFYGMSTVYWFFSCSVLWSILDASGFVKEYPLRIRMFYKIRIYITVYVLCNILDPLLGLMKYFKFGTIYYRISIIYYSILWNFHDTF